MKKAQRSQSICVDVELSPSPISTDAVFRSSASSMYSSLFPEPAMLALQSAHEDACSSPPFCGAALRNTERIKVSCSGVKSQTNFDDKNSSFDEETEDLMLMILS